MLLLDELRLELEGYRKDMKELYVILNIDKLKEEISQLQEQSAADGFWDDLENSQKVMQTIKQNEATIENYKKLNDMLEDTLTMIELTVEEGQDEDEDTINDLRAEADKFKAELETTKLTTLLTGEYDSKTQFSPSTQAQAERKRRTGQKCFSECTTAGQSVTTSR